MVSRASTVNGDDSSKHTYREAMPELPGRTATIDHAPQPHMPCPTCSASLDSRSGWNSESPSGTTTPCDTQSTVHGLTSLAKEDFATVRSSFTTVQDEPYHVFSRKRKLLYVFVELWLEFRTLIVRRIVALVSLSATFSPLASNIYFPALDLIADDMNVDNSTINFTITTYL